MQKRNLLILIVVVIAVALIAGLWILNPFKKSSEKTIDDADKGANTITEKASEGTLPDLNTNPLKNAPDTNPVSKTNPYRDIKTNPFE